MFQEMGIPVHAVACSGLSGYHVGTSIYQQVARDTRGLFLDLRELSSLVPIIVGVAATELDRLAASHRLLAVFEQHQAALRVAPTDRLRLQLLTALAREQGVRVRFLQHDPNSSTGGSGNKGTAPVMGERDLEEDDVRAALQQLAREKRAPCTSHGLLCDLGGGGADAQQGPSGLQSAAGSPIPLQGVHVAVRLVDDLAEGAIVLLVCCAL